MATAANGLMESPNSVQEEVRIGGTGLEDPKNINGARLLFLFLQEQTKDIIIIIIAAAFTLIILEQGALHRHVSRQIWAPVWGFVIDQGLFVYEIVQV